MSRKKLFLHMAGEFWPQYLGMLMSVRREYAWRMSSKYRPIKAISICAIACLVAGVSSAIRPTDGQRNNNSVGQLFRHWHYHAASSASQCT
jgi:hypothetical protein